MCKNTEKLQLSTLKTENRTILSSVRQRKRISLLFLNSPSHKPLFGKLL